MSELCESIARGLSYPVGLAILGGSLMVISFVLTLWFREYSLIWSERRRFFRHQRGDGSDASRQSVRIRDGSQRTDSASDLR